MISTLFGLILWIFILLILAIPLFLLAVIKLIVIVLCSVLKNGRNKPHFQPLSGPDCMLTPDCSWKKPVVNSGFLLIVEGSIPVEDLRKLFASCFLNESEKYDKLSSYLDSFGGYMFQVTSPTISIEDHIYERPLESGQSLEKFLAEWMISGYKTHAPCWEIVVIPGISGNQNGNDGTGVAFKIHHALADGYSNLHILDKLTNHKSPYLVKDFTEGFATQFKQLLEGPLHLGKMSADPEGNPFRVKWTPSQPHQWMISFTSFKLEYLKNIRREHEVHMSTVVWTIVSGALRQYLLESGTQADSLPEFIFVGNTLPWPRHPTRDPKIEAKDSLCNHWVSAIFKVSLREPDPLLRMKAIEKDFLSFQSLGLDKFMKRAMLPVMWLMPRTALVKGMMSSDLGVGAGLTSLIGGDNYHLLGKPVSSIHHFLAIHDNMPFMPFSCFTFSHSGKMELTIGANPSVFHDQQTLDTISHKFCHNELSKLLS